jgi:hypothetical protein
MRYQAEAGGDPRSLKSSVTLKRLLAGAVTLARVVHVTMSVVRCTW